jgi:hypothetical protein
MLFDPKWDRNSLTGLRDWLATQDPDQEYVWHSCQGCVVGRFLRAQGKESVNYSEWVNDTPGAAFAVGECFSDYGPSGGRETTTLGMALKRLDAWMLAYMGVV